MNPVGSGSAYLHSTQPVKSQNTAAHSSSKSDSSFSPAPLVERKEGSDKVSLSEEGKVLLKTLTQIDKTGTLTPAKEKSLGDKVESFTYGALGLENPDKKGEEAEKDGSYSAGTYLKAAATIGGILLAVV